MLANTAPHTASTAYQRFRDTKHFGSLDGLRAVAVIAVAWHHTQPQTIANSGTAVSHLGSEGVTLFFAISGFLITTLLLREKERMGHIDLAAFYIRRTLRIFPLYYATLALYTIAVIATERHSFEGRQFFANLPYFATFTSNLFVELKGRVIFYFSWSLAAEEQYYLLWPPLLVLLRNLRRAAGALGVLMLAGFLAQMFLGSVADNLPLAIIAGSLLAICAHTSTGYALLYKIVGRSWTPIAATILIGLCTLPYVPIAVLHIAFAILVASCVLTEEHAAARLLSWRPLAYIGSISYGIYLLHMLCKNAALKILSGLDFSNTELLTFPATLVLAIILATISHAFFEKPILALKGRFQRSNNSTGAAAKS
jgi:peptidoglycan/LPS O-acetylase OafA/YrhL